MYKCDLRLNLSKGLKDITLITLMHKPSVCEAKHTENNQQFRNFIVKAYGKGKPWIEAMQRNKWPYARKNKLVND